ncbi:hypothetical protein CR513_00815, partial [Mucuna pruriens]
MEGNTHHIHFKNSCNPMTFYLKGHAHRPHNKMGLSSPSLVNEYPFTRLFCHSPNYSSLRIFGCVLCPSSSTRTYQALIAPQDIYSYSFFL